MFDTNIYDEVTADPALLARIKELTQEEKIRVLTTHIQEDEIDQINDDTKRTKFREISTTRIPTDGFILDISRLDEACLDGGPAIEVIQGPTSSNSKDALIGNTAMRQADVLVTNDERLYKKTKRLSANCTVMTGKELEQYLFSTKIFD
jgi:predicted nucleic acid-binding protein